MIVFTQSNMCCLERSLSSVEAITSIEATSISGGGTVYMHTRGVFKFDMLLRVWSGVGRDHWIYYMIVVLTSAIVAVLSVAG